ncbi:MAG: protoporphyrinogen oxidase HemJ [Rhodospirillum sp.]|nr:protoporphyrinogen oxidase HemJ [Rhodospirillum sp.]MCF8491636.1 protoporphyrinogen oxidase HemJ [Rhodospirillum sp.]MCF8500123.1 protoporphyrinogen oxidase HemJ [Rhodospirillum sp.]
MLSFGTDWYNWAKTLHVIAVITWMAGLFYLPRLYVYHAQEPKGSATSETFKVMERRLLRGIMNPSLVVVLATGIPMMGDWMSGGWLHVKLLMVAGLITAHMLYARWRRAFAEDRNTRSHVFYRYANEVPTVLLLVIVPLVILKPF